MSKPQDRSKQRTACRHCGESFPSEPAARGHLRFCAAKLASSFPAKLASSLAAAKLGPANPAKVVKNIDELAGNSVLSLSSPLEKESSTSQKEEKERAGARTIAGAGNDPVSLPLPLTRQEAAALLPKHRRTLSGIEHSVTRAYIRGSRLSRKQVDILDGALTTLQTSEEEEVEAQAARQEQEKSQAEQDQRVAARQASEHRRMAEAEERFYDALGAANDARIEEQKRLAAELAEIEAKLAVLDDGVVVKTLPPIPALADISCMEEERVSAQRSR